MHQIWMANSCSGKCPNCAKLSPIHVIINHSVMFLLPSASSSACAHAPMSGCVCVCVPVHVCIFVWAADRTEGVKSGCDHRLEIRQSSLSIHTSLFSLLLFLD